MREPKKETTYYKDGSVSYEEYFIDGKLHRVDGPAYISYYKDGSVSHESYRIDGELHRVDGPALIGYYEDGSVSSVSYRTYYIDGKHLSREEHALTIKEAKELDKANQLLDPRAWVRELGRVR